MWTTIEKPEEPQDALTLSSANPNPPADQLVDINEADIEELSDGESRIRNLDTESGKIGWAILWLLGIPLPILIIAYLIWGR